MDPRSHSICLWMYADSSKRSSKSADQRLAVTPQNELWIDRREWEELSPKLSGGDRTPALKLISMREKRGG